MSLVLLPAVPSIVVGFLFILAGSSLTACNQSDAPSDAPSQNVPNQHQAAGLTLDPVETPEFLTADWQESISGENSGGLAGLAPYERSEIAYFQADTDGDGSQEEVYLCRSARVCIKHDGLSSLSIYSNPNWQTVSLVAVHDTDGEAGSEIIVVAISKDASLACICVIHERTGAVESYRAAGWHTASIFATTDIDGDKAAEVFILARDNQDALQCICVIHDRERTIHTYHSPIWSTLGSYYIEDADGRPGKELIVEIRDRNNGLACVCIIHDQNEQAKIYNESHWHSGTVNQLVDTDGQPGMEIVVSYTSESANGIAVIHDREESISDYSFSGDNPTIQQVADFDSAKGAELCVLLANRDALVLIADRTHEQMSVEACGPLADQDQLPHKPKGLT
ncbi:MAG: hypothetical protein K2X00_00010 [Nitrospiraceae bacterium]|nr:hypothetical protein [Nitrospiraceae bacterium]